MKALTARFEARAAERIDRRWREGTDDPAIFARERLAAIELLETTPGPGSPVPTRSHPQDTHRAPAARLR